MCWNPTREEELDAVLDPPDGEFAHVAVGVVHACAIRLDGTVACWGNNSDKPKPLCDARITECPE